MIYLDANSTSRLRPELLEVFAALSDQAGLRNPSSVHELGRHARSRLTSARRFVMQALGFSPGEKAKVIFTSGGTEACNEMIFGFLGRTLQLAEMRGHIVTSALEHPAVLEALKVLEASGWEITRISPQSSGIVAVEDFCAAIKKSTALVCLMAAHNETGALQPIVPLAERLREMGYVGAIVSDFTQAVAKTELHVSDFFQAGGTAAALSGHKLGAPSGIGALVISEDSRTQCFSFEPLLRGGPQEGGFRPGTENLFGALCLGEVCRLIVEAGSAGIAKRRSLRDRFWGKLQEIPDIQRITPEDTPGKVQSLANTLMVGFSGCRGDDLVVALDLNGLCASTGSACASGKQGVSGVVAAMGYGAERAREVVRFSLDWDATEDTVDRAAEIIASTVQGMRGEVASMRVAN